MNLDELFEKYPHPRYELEVVGRVIVVFGVDGDPIHTEPEAEHLILDSLTHTEETNELDVSNRTTVRVNGSDYLRSEYGGNLDKALQDLHRGLVTF